MIKHVDFDRSCLPKLYDLNPVPKQNHGSQAPEPWNLSLSAQEISASGGDALLWMALVSEVWELHYITITYIGGILG